MPNRLWIQRIFCLGVLLLAGCVNSPQSLSPKPEIQENLIQPIGRGQAVGVQVVDGRSSDVLGTRGGLYPETSTIRVSSANVIPRLTQQVEMALRLMGFTPVRDASVVPMLRVTLAELSYQSPKDDVYVTEADIAAALQVQARNATQQYSGRYRASLNQGFGMAPNEASNTKLISQVLSDALNRTFQDAKVGQVLNQ